MASSSSSSSIKIPALFPESSKNIFICKVCGKGFPRSYGLERHALTHNENRAELEIKCPFDGCSFSALQKSNVKNHYASVHEKKKHVCTQPRVTFGSPYDSSTPQCGQLFSDQSALIRHEKNAHNYFRRQAKEAAACAGTVSGSQYLQVNPASSAVGASRLRRGGESVDLKFMPPLTYDPNTNNPVPSEKKVQSWLKSVDGRTAAGKRASPANAMMEELHSPQPGYAYSQGYAYGIGQSQGYAHGHGHGHGRPQPHHTYASQSDSESTSGSGSLQTTSSAYNPYGAAPMGPGLYFPSEKTMGIQSMDCFDYMYNREDLRQQARMQGGYVASLDML